MQGMTTFKQGEEIAAVLEARSPRDGSLLYPIAVIQVSRRAAKTTSIWDVILGRCDSRPGYKVVTTAQDGTRARNRFLEVLRALEAADFEGKVSAANRRGKLRWANGSESIEFDNGSRIWVVPPDPAALRGEAADLMFFDEAGELSAEKSDSLVAGAFPLMDTRPDGQIVIAGTPALKRVGLFWHYLAAAREGAKGIGIVDYSVRDAEQTHTVDEDGRKILNEKLLLRVHPGIGTLTKLETMRNRFENMPLDQFEREYMCRWPMDASVSALNATAWAECSAGQEMPPRPDKVGIAFDVSPDGSCAALAAAWRDEEGRACLELLAFNPGTNWLGTAGSQAWRKHKGRIAYDLIGANQEPSERLHRMRVGLNPLKMRDMQGAAARIADEIDRKNIVQWDQDGLTAAVEGAAWRSVGDGGRLFGRKASAAEVCPIVAVSAALWVYDQSTRSTAFKPSNAGVS